jgi:transcriptional regulator with XRE-family HTH domain
MERAQLSTARGKERTQLIAARKRLFLTQQDVADRLKVGKTTVHKWEKEGVVPQPEHLRALCDLYGVSPQELGFTVQELGLEEPSADVQTITEEHDALAAFREKDLSLRLDRVVGNWSRCDARYHLLQIAILMDLGDDNMNLHEEMNRRDALKRLVVASTDFLGLTAMHAVLKRSPEEILVRCAAGITACWYLRRGEELVFADHAVSKYIPTLKAIVRNAPEAQRKAAADLLVQCLLLKAALAWTIAPANNAILNYAQEAESYCAVAENRLLHITTLRLKAAALWHINQWKQALGAAQQAKYLLEERDKQDKQKQKSVFSKAEKPIPQLVYSHIYIGLANCQAHDGRKEDALLSLQKAHATFLAQSDDESVPSWIDHSIGNLLVTASETQTHLGLYKEAIDTLEQMDTRYVDDPNVAFSFRIEAAFDRVLAEVSRDDKPRNMQWCIDQWKKGVQGARTLQSDKRLNEAIQVHKIMRVAWPAEQQIKDLHELIAL